MAYTSCMYAPPDPSGMTPQGKEGENARIVCQDEQGTVWWLSEDSHVGDWLRYVDEGGTVEAYDEAAFHELSQPMVKP